MMNFIIFFIVALFFLGYIYFSWRSEKKQEASNGRGGGGTDHEKPSGSEHDKEQDNDRM